MSAIQVSSPQDLQKVGELLSKSGYFADAREAAQAAVKVMAGGELGFGPFASVTGVHIIKGKPSVGAGLMAAAVKRSAKYDYEVIEHTDKVCKIAFFKKQVEADILALKRRLAVGELTKAQYLDTLAILAMGISEFTIEDARKAQCQNLDKYPRNMLFARAMSNGFRWYCQDLTGAPIYTPEELGERVDADGEPITVASVQVVETTPEPVAVTVGTDDKLRRRYFAALAEAGIDDVGRETLKAICKVQSTNDLTAAQVDAIISKLEPEKVAILNTGVNPKTGERLVVIPEEVVTAAA